MPNTLPDPLADASRRPTLRDVAAESGYHATTVSKALRDHPSIPTETRQNIQAIAQRMGYERNPVYYALSRFRNDKNHSAPGACIAYLENFGRGSGIIRLQHRELILQGAQNQAQLLGYKLEVISVGEDDHDTRSLTHHLRDQHIAGIVIGDFQPGCAEIALNWDDFAVAKVNSRHTEPEATVVSNDQLREVRLSFRKLKALGYQRIGLAIGRSDEDGCGHRHTAGYLMEAAALPEAQRVPPLLFPYNINESALSAMLGRWVRRNAIDVVLCNWQNIADMLRQAELKVPEQVACANLCLCDTEEHYLAGVRPRLDLVGERAVSIVVAQLKSSILGLPEFPSSLYVQSDWQDGPSAPSRLA